MNFNGRLPSGQPPVFFPYAVILNGVPTTPQPRCHGHDLHKKRQEIGERLRHERERLGYTKQQIAQLLGVPIPAYERFENGDDDPGVYRLPRLAACGFDVMFIITAERHVPVAEENELLSRFRDLSQRGRASIFSTMDALERLAPNLKQEFRRRFKN